MGTICSSQQVITLDDQTKRRHSLTHKLEMSSPIFSEPSQSFYSDYKLHIKPIDISPYSEISKCYKITNNKLRSVKISSKFQLPSSTIDERFIFKHFDLLKRSKIEKSLKLYQIYESKDSYYVIQEFIQEGSIRDVLEENPLSEQTSSKVLSQVIKFMLDLQKSNFSLYYILPQNILISDLETWQIKVNLFCFRYFIEEEFFLRNSNKREPWNAVFLLWFFLTGKSLNKNPDFSKDKDWRNLSPACQDLIKRLLASEISIAEALSHPWIVNNF